jgi:hypothetical protein
MEIFLVMRSLKTKAFVVALLLLLTPILCAKISAQQVVINPTGAAGNASAILDVASTTRGLLIPRMTTLQRNAIAAPAEGLMIYNLDCKDINLYNGTIWLSMMFNAPVSAAATGINPTSFIANWNGNGSTNYLLDVSTSPTFASFLPGYNGLNVGTVTTYSITGLTCGTTYYYRLRGQNGCGSSSSSNIISVTLPCCINNYNVMSIPFAPVAGAGTGVILGDDQSSAMLPIGFTFNFYCVNYTQFHIADNAYIGFNAPSLFSGCCSGQCLPDATDPNNLISAAWEDWYTVAGGTISYFTTGIAPNRRLVVNWTNVPHYPGGAGNFPGTFQIVCYETTNIIEVFITNMPSDGGLHTMGVENATGTASTIVPGRSCSSWNATNEGWRFY